jgi:hypothetical protein
MIDYQERVRLEDVGTAAIFRKRINGSVASVGLRAL